MKNKKLYYWEGISSSGFKISGKTFFKDKKNLISHLLKEKIIIIKVERNFFSNVKKITNKEISDFFMEISFMINSGISLISSIKIFIESCGNQSLKYIIYEIQKKIENGVFFSKSLLDYPEYFDNLCCNMVYAGESSGKLGAMIETLVSYRKKMDFFKKKIKKALFYPIFVLVFSFLVMFSIFLFVIPQFKILFDGAKISLPFITKMIIFLSDFLTKHILCIFFCC